MQRVLKPLSAVLLCLLGGLAQAAGPSSTGLAADGTQLSPGAVDAHYTVTGGDLTDAPTYAAQNPAGYPGYWPKNDDLLGWITPALTGNGDAANQPEFIFTYTTGSTRPATTPSPPASTASWRWTTACGPSC